MEDNLGFYSCYPEQEDMDDKGLKTEIRQMVKDYKDDNEGVLDADYIASLILARIRKVVDGAGLIPPNPHCFHQSDCPVVIEAVQAQLQAVKDAIDKEV